MKKRKKNLALLLNVQAKKPKLITSVTEEEFFVEKTSAEKA